MHQFWRWLSFLVLLPTLLCWTDPLTGQDETENDVLFQSEREPGVLTLASSESNADIRFVHCPAKRKEDGWNGSLDLGLTGAEGNSRNVNFVAGFDAKRKVDLETLTIDVDYLFTRDEDEVTKDRFYSLTRYEHDIPNSDWGWFVDKWFEYDGLESFKARLGLHAGASLP